MDTIGLTIQEARSQIANSRLGAAELLAACTAQIDRLNPVLNAFITVAEMTSDVSGRDLRQGLQRQTSEVSLAGIPIAIKDLYDTAGVRTTAGSLFFKDNVPAEDAVVVSKLFAEGAVSVGKTNTHEIALGLTNVNPHFGACRNPWDTSRVSGGSSGGSAVAVATGMALAAIGTDTGGSIRVPAALCGVVGLKPTYGRVSLRGVLPLSWTLDHAGPLTKSVRDAALMLQVMAGYDEADPSSVQAPVDDYLAYLDGGIKDWKIALASGEYVDESDADVRAALESAAETFTDLRAQVSRIDVSWLREAALANGIIVLADGAAFHAERLAAHPDWFGADVRQRLEMGAAFSSGDYARARRTQVRIKREAEGFFREYDLLILPTTPNTAPPIDGSDALEQARRLTRFTAPFNLTGSPAISVPCARNKTSEVAWNGPNSGNSKATSEVYMPIGLQLVSAHWAEARLLQAAHAFELAIRKDLPILSI